MLKKIAFIVFSAAFFRLPAAAAPRAAVQYVGAISINPSQDAKVLADWYSKFGLETKLMGGVYFGKFDTAAGPFLFAIHRKKTGAPNTSSSSVSVVFRINDYDAYVAMLQGRGLAAESTESDFSGRFAHYKDPDGNEMTIWGN